MEKLRTQLPRNLKKVSNGQRRASHQDSAG